MFRAFLTSWPLFIGLAILFAGHGLLYTLIGLRADLEGFSGILIGVIQSSYFVGFLAASLIVPRVIQRVGHVRVFGALASLASAATLGFVLDITAVTWVLMRFAVGFCIAGILVISESWLNDQSDNANRGTTLGLYMIASWGMAAVGQLLLNLAEPTASTLFLLSSILISLAVAPILLSANRAPRFEAPAHVALAELYRISPLGVIATFAAGLTQGAVYSTSGLFAARSALDVSQTALFALLILLSGVLAQWPVGALSDRFDRRWVLTGICLVAGLIGLTAGLIPSSTPLTLLIAAAAFGAPLGPIYSLAIAHTNDYLRPEQIIAASGSLILIYGVGSVFGPLFMGPLIDTAGPASFFIASALALLVIGGFALYRMTRRAPAEEQGEYVTFSPGGSLYSATLYPEHKNPGQASVPADR
jgi:MFS family permease